MSLTEKLEKEHQIMSDVAKSLNSSVVNPIKDVQFRDDGVSSYYEDASGDTGGYIMEYDFDSVVELRQELAQLWLLEDFMYKFIPVVLASTFKKRKNVHGDEKSLPSNKSAGDDDQSGGLPTYIYNF